MPNYIFECSECTHSFEQFETIANIDNPLKEPCPKCEHKGSIIRLVGHSQIVDPVSIGLKKVPKDFNDLLHNMNARVPGVDIKVRD